MDKIEDNMEDTHNPSVERQTSSDVQPFRKPVVSTKQAAEHDDIERVIPDHLVHNHYGDYYDMSGEKYLFILNHYEFQRTVYYNYQMYSPRKGTLEDVGSLNKTFGSLGFKVVVYNDLAHEEIVDMISNFCSQDHEKTSCVAVAILTHGERGGDVCAADRAYSVNDITTMLQHTPGLAGKPKLVFVQACRGQKIDEGQRIQLDGDDVSIVIPTHADCLVLYSSIEEYLSFRDVNGSWMIQALCTVIEENHRMLDILQMMTLVLRSVAFRFTNTPSNKLMHNKKQMPEVRFTLTKFLRFTED